MISKSISTVALTALALFGGAAQAVELVSNGNFSAGLTGWNQDAGGQPGASISVVDGAAQLIAGAGPSDVIIKAANLGLGFVTPGQTVNVSFDAKGTFGPGGVAFVQLFSENACNPGPCGANKTDFVTGGPLMGGASFGWTRFSQPMVLGNNVDGGISLMFKASCGAVQGCAASAMFDNASITAVPEPETYALMLAGLAGVGLMVRRRRAA